jgi:hypothetical protein
MDPSISETNPSYALPHALSLDRDATSGLFVHQRPDPTFSDYLAVIRRLLWADEAVRPILWRDDFPTWRSRPRTAEKPRPINERLAEIMS